MGLSAFDSLRRGVASTRANWELVPLQVLQNLVVLALSALGLALPFVVLGADLLATLPADAGDLAERLARLAERARPSAALAAALVGASAVWLLAAVVYCWFQAGTYGVLVAADRQAPPGPSRDRRWFRTFRRADFFGWGGAYLWRFFWLANLFALLAGGLALLAVVGLVLAVRAGERWGAGAALGLGCGGSLPLGFLALVLALWLGLAQADLAREGSGVREASRRGLEVLGRRLGAVVVLLLSFGAAALGVALVFLPLSFLTDVLTSDRPALRAVLQLALSLLQWIPGSVVAIALAATLVALVRGEAGLEGRAS